MRQSPRLNPPGNAGNGAGQRSGAAPASVPPATPRKNGEGLNALLRSLESQHRLGLTLRCDWSPRAHSRTTADSLKHQIQYLYYSESPVLDDAIKTFVIIKQNIKEDDHAKVLLKLLRNPSQQESACSGSGSTIRAKATLRKDHEIPLPSVHDTLQSKGLFNGYVRDATTSSLQAVPDPGSPTDEDEYEFVTPPPRRELTRSPSPSITSKSAIRRVEASAHLSQSVTSRKRASESSFVEDEKSRKLTKTVQGEQPFRKPQLPRVTKPSSSNFTKPPSETRRSFSTIHASQSTVNTSFNTVSSSQQTGADTANTSFTSDAGHTAKPSAFRARGGSTIVHSLGVDYFTKVNAKLTEELVTSEKWVEPSSCSSQCRDNSSTWGSSIPEEDLLAASERVESSHHHLPDHDSLTIGGSQPVPSLAKGKTSVFGKETMSLNRSFPPPPGVSAMLSPNKRHVQSGGSSNSQSPIRPQQRSSTPAESPSKINHHIRNIPSQNLFVQSPPLELRAMPYFALFICQRISLEHSVPLTELIRSMDVAQACADPRVFWASLLAHPKVTNVKYKDSDRLWSAATRQFEGYTFKGQINLRSRRTGPIFLLNLHPILSEKSCRFQRKFGADRFLYLNVPELDVSSKGATHDELKLIRERLNDWLHTEHEFLFRKWRVIHIEPMKKSKTKHRTSEVTHKFRIILFATEGCGINEIYTVGEILNWFFPFSNNLHQTFCKAYARFDLGFSRTTPTLTFLPSQIERVDDVLANGEPEDTDFNDFALKWPRTSDRMVMNDGCSVMSVGAALEIWKSCKKSLGVTGPLPSVFQGRIGGAKGLWMVSAESYTKDPHHLAIWITVSDSQLKFNPHQEDLSDTTYDPLRLTFEVSNYSTAPARSELHISFIPIMADRGVPREVIGEYMTERLGADRRELLDMVKDPVRLYEYVHKSGSTRKEGSDMPWQAALPANRDDKIKFLLEAGFTPLRLQVLAKHFMSFVKNQHLTQESKLKTALGKATYLYGIADPFGVLAPGEVHIQFSSAFVDDLTNEKYMNLKGHNLLVARQPALRNSDIQKVRAIVHPELAHLVDVVVFPSRGQFPLAGKLQGGDYDGDIFWLCWEDRLVAPFHNAPAPVESPDPEQYAIKVDKQTLNDLCVDHNNEATIDAFLKEAFVFRAAPSLLGIVTLYFEKQSYRENRLSSLRLDHIANMHDLLVDAPKQGYTFDVKSWRSYLETKLQCKVHLKPPAYKKAMDACAAAKENSTGTDTTREERGINKADHIVDHLYFEVVRPHNVKTMKLLQDILSSAVKPDADLLYPHEQLSNLKDPIIDEALRQVQDEMVQIYKSWNANQGKDNREKKTSTRDFSKVVEELYGRFIAIKPSDTGHPMIRSWLHSWHNPDFCEWDRLRASILYARLPALTAQTFVFQMAGDELAKMKASRCSRTRHIVPDIRAIMKPKPTRALIQNGGDTDTDDDDDGSEAEQRTA